MQLILLRHGQTPGNLEHRYNGRTDEPLCEEGKASARKAGVYESVSKVYVSPMQRAQQTASICFPQAQQMPVEGFEEMDFGIFEGRTYDELLADADTHDAYSNWLDTQCTSQCPQGESRQQFIDRTRAAFEGFARAELLDPARCTQEPLVIVAHGGTIMALVSELSDEPISYFDCQVHNCGGFIANLELEDNGNWSLSEAHKLLTPEDFAAICGKTLSF